MKCSQPMALINPWISFSFLISWIADSLMYLEKTKIFFSRFLDLLLCSLFLGIDFTMIEARMYPSPYSSSALEWENPLLFSLMQFTLSKLIESVPIQILKLQYNSLRQQYSITLLASFHKYNSIKVHQWGMQKKGSSRSCLSNVQKALQQSNYFIIP